MPYQFESYRNPFVSPTVALMLRSGDIQAQRAAQLGQIQAQQAAAQGQIWGGFANSIGQTIGQIPGQIQQARGMEQAQQMNALRLQEAQRQAGGQQAMAGLMGGDQLPQGDAGPRQPSYLSEDGLFDIPKIAQRLGQLGYGDRAGELVKSAEGMNAQILKARDTEQAAAKERTILFGDAAHGAIQMMQHGAAPTDALDFASQPLLASKLVKPEDFARVRDQILQLPPDQQMQALNTLRDAAAKLTPTKNLAEGVTETDRYGRVVATGGQKPKDFTLGEGQVRFDESGNPIAYGPDKPTTPKAYQHVDKLLDGKPATLLLDPAPGGKLYDLSGKPIENASTRVKPMPPASVQVNTANAAAAAAPIKEGSREYRTAQDLAYGKLTFQDFTRLYPSRGSGPQAALRAAVYDKARELNPAFDPSQFELGFKMASNPQMRQRLVAIDSLSPVISQAEDLARQVGNTDIPALNKLIQGAKFHIGDKDVTNFRQLQTLLGDEVGNALGVGTGSDLKTRLGLDLVNPNLGPQQFLDTMEQLRSVLNARRDTLLKTMGPYGGQNPAGGPKPTHRYNPATGKVEPIS